MTDVSTPSRQYQRMAPHWQQMRDCAAGQHAIKAAGVKYLPALAGQLDGTIPNADYLTYKTRALYYNATARTVDGLVGMVGRRPPIVDLPPAADLLRADVDGMGRSIEDFADAGLLEVVTTGRAAILVDHTRVQEDFSEGPIGSGGPTELRPYMALYAAEAILDTIYETRGGMRQLVQARLAEAMEVPSAAGDEFSTDEVSVVRVLELVDGVYRQRVFEARQTHDRLGGGERLTWQEREDLAVEPTMPDGKRMTFIPLWVIGSGASTLPGDIDVPPLLDLSDVNLTHYRQDADLRNALHMAGVPTPYCLGMSEPADPIKVGSQNFLWFDGPNVREVGYLSYGAEGVDAIRQAMHDLEQQMAFLGARMLQADRRGVEAAETARIHRMGEISILARLSNMVSNGLTRATLHMLEWAGIPTTDEHKVKLNDDFLPTPAAPQLLAEMMKAWQANAISHDSLWRAYQEGEVVDPRRTVEDELMLIDEEKRAAAEMRAEMMKLFPEQQMVPPRLNGNAGEQPPPPGGQRRQDDDEPARSTVNSG